MHWSDKMINVSIIPQQLVVVFFFFKEMCDGYIFSDIQYVNANAVVAPERHMWSDFYILLWKSVKNKK